MATRKQSFDFAPGGELRVDQESGAVRIQAWDQNTAMVQATAEEEADLQERLVIKQDRHRLAVSVEHRPWSFFNRGNRSIHLEIFVPRGTRSEIDCSNGPISVMGTRAPVKVDCGNGMVEVADVQHTELETGFGKISARQVDGALSIETGAGLIEVQQVRGNVSLETGSGAIAAHQVCGDLEAETGSGALTVTDLMGRADLSTGSGAITAQRIQGPSLTASTGGGVLTLTQLDLDRLDVDSASGNVKVELVSVHQGGHYQVEASSGRVEVAVPPSADLRIDVEAHSGRITHDGLQLQTIRTEPGELEAVMGRGTARLQIESANHVTLIPAQGAPPGTAALLKTIKADAALSQNEHVQKVLAMVAEGKLSPDEADDLLRALDDEEATV